MQQHQGWPMSDERYHRLLGPGGSRRFVRALLMKEGGVLDDESAFLVAACLILKGSTVTSLDKLIAKTIRTMQGRTDGWIVTDEHEIASAQISKETVAISGHYVDPVSVSSPRFVELLEGWRGLLVEDLMTDVDGTRSLLQDDDDEIDDDIPSTRFAVAILEAVGRPETRYRLSTGRVTASREEAVRDLPRRQQQSADVVARVLLELATSQVSAGRSTPARIDAVRWLVQAGLVPEAHAERFLGTGCVADGVWVLLAPLRELAAPVETVVRRWSMTLEIDGRRHDLPAEHRPEDHESSPRAELRAIATLLIADGWQARNLTTLQVPDHDLVGPRRRLVLVRPYERRAMPWATK